MYLSLRCRGCILFNGMQQFIQAIHSINKICPCPQTLLTKALNEDDIKPFQDSYEATSNHGISGINYEPHSKNAVECSYITLSISACRQLCDDYNIWLIWTKLHCLAVLCKIVCCEHADIQPNILLLSGKVLDWG